MELAQRLTDGLNDSPSRPHPWVSRVGWLQRGLHAPLRRLSDAIRDVLDNRIPPTAAAPPGDTRAAGRDRGVSLAGGHRPGRVTQRPTPARRAQSWPPGAATYNLRILARLGVKLLEVRGRERRARHVRRLFAENVAFADGVAARLWVMADEFIARQGIEAPEAEPDLGAGRLEPVRIIGKPRPGFRRQHQHHLVHRLYRKPVLGAGAGPGRHGQSSARRVRLTYPELWFVGFPWLTRRLARAVGQDDPDIDLVDGQAGRCSHAAPPWAHRPVPAGGMGGLLATGATGCTCTDVTIAPLPSRRPLSRFAAVAT